MARRQRKIESARTDDSNALVASIADEAGRVGEGAVGVGRHTRATVSVDGTYDRASVMLAEASSTTVDYDEARIFRTRSAQVLASSQLARDALLTRKVKSSGGNEESDTKVNGSTAAAHARRTAQQERVARELARFDTANAAWATTTFGRGNAPTSASPKTTMDCGEGRWETERRVKGPPFAVEHIVAQSGSNPSVHDRQLPAHRLHTARTVYSEASRSAVRTRDEEMIHQRRLQELGRSREVQRSKEEQRE